MNKCFIAVLADFKNSKLSAICMSKQHDHKVRVYSLVNKNGFGLLVVLSTKSP